MRSLAQAWLFLIASTIAANEPIRTWTSADGRTLEARYLEVVGNKVRIENSSGRTFAVPLTGFSPADQEYVKKAHERSLFSNPNPSRKREGWGDRHFFQGQGGGDHS